MQINSCTLINKITINYIDVFCKFWHSVNLKRKNSVRNCSLPRALRMLSSLSSLSCSASLSCFLFFSNSSRSRHKSGFSISFVKVFRRVRSSIPKLFCCSRTVNNALTSTISSLSRAIRFCLLQIEMNRCSSLGSSSARLIFSSNYL